MNTLPSLLQRRRALGWIAALCAGGARAQAVPAHGSMGPVNPPQPALELPLVGEAGERFELRQRLRGRVSAVQLMFTGCSATCPIQGALFAAVAPLLPPAGAQLLSLSIDPLGDTPAALQAWRARFGAHPAWQAALPRVQDVDRLLDFLRGRARGADRHTAQVYLFDGEARLAWRTVEMPPAAHVAALLRQLAGR
ncbi:SCO family protein [Azohydromonas caseinilytica]|uniref:SCO family protein n=1 Tax=Azohydromonas caseinilytica TaxID=2728836 RepID=A0A848FC96_9BURK|nr:SCO family protein [Azohydromonas caseinilytica]NML16566.1 SCO family protein [Azohydromonas caseinilytica]